MKINSVAMLCPLLQPVSLYSLPNAPSLVDLDWEETNTQTGKTLVFQFLDLSLLHKVAKYLFRICLYCLTEKAQVPAEPHFDSRSRIFELDSCGGNGKVCLVYKNCTPGILVAFANVLDVFFRAGRKTVTNFGSFFRSCCPTERNLVPGPLAVLAFSDYVLHVLLQADGHTSGST